MCAERSTEGSTSVSNASRKNNRQIQARIFLLDDSVHTFSINSCAIGHELFMAIIEKQNILEADYFDLEYVNSEGVRCWINHNKCIVKQVGAGKDMVFIFAVKFYTSHPNLLEEEYTRYLFALQIKRDIVSGQLICSTNTAALLASYIVQAEIGDFLDDEYIDNSYLRHLKLVNQPNEEILNKIMEFHKTHIGMSATEADFHLLDTARKIEYYGVKMHLAKDHENLPLNLSVTHMGVVVFQNLTKINTFSWAKIRKLSFKRKKFLIKLHPEGYGYYKGMVEFYFETRDDCKRFWKKCIEHHAFFRCPASEKSLKKTPKVVTKGSSFRYCGRTQKELIEYVRESYSSKRDNFVRPSKARVSKSPHNNKHARHGKSYHPFAIKSSYSADSAPSRAVSDASDLDRTGMNNQTPHTPCKPKSINNLTKTRWSQSARQSPRDEGKDMKEHRDREIRDLKDLKNNKEVGRELPTSTRSGTGSQKRARKGRKFIQVSRTGSSDEDDDDKRVTASEMSLSSSGHWDNSVNGGIVDHLNEDPLPAREAFRGGDRLCRQRASIGGYGDLSDSDQHGSSFPNNTNNHSNRLKPLRQGSEPISQNSQSPPSRKDQQDPPQRVVCIDQYCTKRPRHPESLSQNLRPLVSSKRYKSTPNDVAGNPKLQMVDQLDSSELLSDIPYVLLRRHKSNEPSAGPASVKSASQSQRSLASKSLKSVKDNLDGDRNKDVGFGRIRHSKSLDRRLAAMDSSLRPTMAPKSPKLLREEYMQSQRRHISDRDTIEALKNQLRSASSVRSVSRMPNGDISFRSQATGPMFVSAYRLPPVNNFSAKDDTMSPQTFDLDRLYGRSNRVRKKVPMDSNANDGDDEVDADDIKTGNKARKIGKDSNAFSDSDDSQLHETADLECLLDLLPGNPVYLDSSCSSDDGEFDLSPDRCGRPRSVSESEFKLRTPRSSRRSSLCRGHNSSLSLTDSSFNSGTSFQSEEEGDISGSPYSFLAECSQQHNKEAKNVEGSSGNSPQLPDDNVPDCQSRTEAVDLQILEAPQLDDSPTESDTNPEMELQAPGIDNMSIDRDESGSSSEGSNKCALSSESASASASSDRVVIVDGSNNKHDDTVTEQENINIIQPNILVTSPTSTQNSVTQLLESMLQKRLAGSPFVRTSTPTQEYEINECSLHGSTDNIHQHKPESFHLKSAASVPGLVTGRVSPYSPLPSYLRRPFASSSSSSSSPTSSISAKNTNPFIGISNSNNPFTSDAINEAGIFSQPVDNFNISNPNNNYEHLFEQSMVYNSKEPTHKPASDDSVCIEPPSPPPPPPFKLGGKDDLDRALVFLNEGALSSISVGIMTPTNHELAGTFQDTVEGNLMCYESSEYTSRPQSLPDEEEPDEYVLPSDHRSFSEDTSSSASSSSSSQDSSESGHYQAAPHTELILKEPIQEHSESSTSASEGSEDIEPFPPPPPASDLLIFDERDEDIFQQLENSTFAGSQNNDIDYNVLPQLDCMNSPTDFPQPPPPLTTTSGSYSKEELSSSEVPSLFADDSAATSVAPIEDDHLSGIIISSPVGHDDPVEEIIIPQHASLLYDPETSSSCDSPMKGGGVLTVEASLTEGKEDNYACQDSVLSLPYESGRVDYDCGRVSYEDAFPQMDFSLSSLDPKQLNYRSSGEIVEETE